MAIASRKFQAPRGTRDFYPQDMAVRRYIESIWRTTSINHGFDEVEGPTFEHLELYTHKSGPGIASELFCAFSGKDAAEIEELKRTGKAPFALRPEFTPTLARMIAAKAAELPRPIKWFAIPSHFRAERPQRGRLREFLQWNVDFVGDESACADAEVIATAIGALDSMGLTPHDVQVQINDRVAVQNELLAMGVSPERLADVFDLLDRVEKLSQIEFNNESRRLGINPSMLSTFVNQPLREQLADLTTGLISDLTDVPKNELRLGHLTQLQQQLESLSVIEWCILDTTIVRGLAYYTGTVFEIHEATGAERAIAGGGRYDNLIESFGGPSLPACGFGMGDVVLGNLLHDKGLLPEDVYMKPLRPHAFAIAASDEADPRMRQEVAKLRRDGFHVRHSYKATRNVGKLLGDAGKSRALAAIIFGKDLAADRIDLKDLQSGAQETIVISDLEGKLKEIIARHEGS